AMIARRYAVLLFIAALFCLPLLALCALTVLGPPSVESAIFTIALTLFVVGSFAAPWRRTRSLVVGGLALMIAVVGYRFFAAAEGTSVHAQSGRDGSEQRWMDRIVPERDVALGGSTLLLATGHMPPGQPGLLDALRDGYARMQSAEGPVP